MPLLKTSETICTSHTTPPISAASTTATSLKPLIIFKYGCKDHDIGLHYHRTPGLVLHTEASPMARLDRPSESRRPQGVRLVRSFVPVLACARRVHVRSSKYYCDSKPPRRRLPSPVCLSSSPCHRLEDVTTYRSTTRATWPPALIYFPQWAGSEKLRNTG